MRTPPRAAVPEEQVQAIMAGMLEGGPSTTHALRLGVDSGGTNALGVPVLELVHVAIVPEGDRGGLSVDDAIRQMINGAVAQARRLGRVHVAAFALEAHQYTGMDADAGGPGAQRRAAELAAERRLEEHPDAQEVTLLYAACADGRRWHGVRWHGLGGHVDGPHVLAPRHVHQADTAHPFAASMRAAVSGR